ncbi:MAG: NHL repeat-containing protein, partial [Thermodesulfobacteriota bacterium]
MRIPFPETTGRWCIPLALILLIFACVAPVSTPPSTPMPLPAKSLTGKSKFAFNFPADKPISLAIDSQNRLMVGKNKGIDLFELDGKRAGRFSSVPQGVASFENPCDIDFSRERIYILDSVLNKLFIFSSNGTYLESFGNRGSGPKEFNSPTGVAVYEGVVFVTDTGNRRIQVFGANGTFIRTIGPNLLAKSEKAKKGFL